MSSNRDNRDDILRHLSDLRVDEILRFLPDDAILQLALRYYAQVNGTMPPGLEASLSPPGSGAAAAALGSAHGTSRNPLNGRNKRPLNAFMAFRTFNLKLFPDIQQKIASGFLTTLWGKDPCRNKWALIAKVYSFIRDEIGKANVSLMGFLTLACPVMRIIAPSKYLKTLGWSIREGRDGLKLIRDEGVAIRAEFLQTEDCPTTELELLTALIDIGYLPTYGRRLMARMNANANGLMTTRTVITQLPLTIAKLDFINWIRLDPGIATRHLLGAAYEQQAASLSGVVCHRVEDINSVDHLPMQPIYQNAAQYYQYTDRNLVVNEVQPAMRDGLPDFEYINIDSPFDVDSMMGYEQQEGERDTDAAPGSPFDPRADFHY